MIFFLYIKYEYYKDEDVIIFVYVEQEFSYFFILMKIMNNRCFVVHFVHQHVFFFFIKYDKFLGKDI